MAVSIDDLIGEFKAPVRSVTICVNGELQAEHDQLNDQLTQLRDPSRGKMSDGTPGLELARRIREIEDEMRRFDRTFKFKGLSRHVLTAIQKRFPSEEANMAWDVTAGGPALLAAAAVEPTMTEEQAKRLLDVISEGQADKLVGAAWIASRGSQSVPFSVRASELLGGNV